MLHNNINIIATYIFTFISSHQKGMIVIHFVKDSWSKSMEVCIREY